mmetsp:Transcript_46626/g.97979  ORF Transcript_46626/g.97979 Transcript_46626/m.97979 type:complete len:293 (+) Transcript_46626:2230-3108(+)
MSIHHTIFQIGIDRHRQVRGNSPRSRRPDRHLQLFVTLRELLQLLRRTHHIQRHVNRFTNVSLGIFQLGLRQRRTTRWTPVHRLPPAENVSLFVHFAKHTNLRRLVLRKQRQVGVGKVANDTVSLERGALLLHRLLGECGGPLAEGDGSQGLTLLRFHRLQHLQLDGEPVTIPSRHVVHLLPFQNLMPIDEILEKLVQRVSDVQVAVGVRRSVVEDEPLGAAGFGIGREFGVEVRRGPVRLQFRFALDGIGTLREVGFGEKDGFGINVFWFLGPASSSTLALSSSTSASFGI